MFNSKVSSNVSIDPDDDVVQQMWRADGVNMSLNSDEAEGIFLQPRVDVFCLLTDVIRSCDCRDRV